MIVRWCADEHRRGRQIFDCGMDCVERASIRDWVSIGFCEKAAQQRNATGKEQENAGEHTSGGLPCADEAGVQRRKQKQVTPEHEFGVVPRPWREPDDAAQ